jgi:hypothetical protein
MKTEWIKTKHGYMQLIKTEFNFESPDLTEAERIEAAARYIAARYGPATDAAAIENWEWEGGALDDVDRSD